MKYYYIDLHTKKLESIDSSWKPEYQILSHKYQICYQIMESSNTPPYLIKTYKNAHQERQIIFKLAKTKKMARIYYLEALCK